MKIKGIGHITFLIRAAFFEQPLEWLRRQKDGAVWIEKNIGKPEVLIGGEWRKD